MEENDKKVILDRLVDEVEETMFMKEHFENIGQADNPIFQTLVFLQKAQRQISIALMIADQGALVENGLKAEYLTLLEKLEQLQQRIRGEVDASDADYLDLIHEIQVVATLTYKRQNYFEIHFLGANGEPVERKVIAARDLKDKGVIVRSSVKKAELWLNTGEGKTWAVQTEGIDISALLQTPLTLGKETT